jgi:cobalt-zinc-cadmium efflux system membrane fusion protein
MIDTPDIVGMQSDYLQAVTAERSAGTTLDLAKRTCERAARLTEAEAIPKRDLLQAQADKSRAADDLQRAQSAITAARGRLRSVGMSEDEINRLAARAHSVNRIVPLVAPISGTITERKAGLGQVVLPGSGDPLFMIADLSSVWVNAELYEDQLAYIKQGAAVKIRTPAYPNETFDASVDQIGSMLDPDKHTVAVRCVLANARGRLKPGMFATVVLRVAATETAITVPSSAVVVEGDHRSVFIEDSPGKYIKRSVETGTEIDDSVVIRTGLKEGERVVVRGSLLISAG